jgi:hypothetical protein
MLPLSMLHTCFSELKFLPHFQLERFTVSLKELAEGFGLEAARIVGGRMAAPARELNSLFTFRRSCLKWNGYLGIVIRERNEKMPVRAIDESA